MFDFEEIEEIRKPQLPIHEFSEYYLYRPITYLMKVTADFPNLASNQFILKITLNSDQVETGQIAKKMWKLVKDFLAEYEKTYPEADVDFKLIDGPYTDYNEIYKKYL